VDGCLARIFVFVEGLTGDERNDGLTELMLVAAIGGGTAATAGGGARELELVTCQGVQ
jgi:hypothetical protein